MSPSLPGSPSNSCWDFKPLVVREDRQSHHGSSSAGPWMLIILNQSIILANWFISQSRMQNKNCCCRRHTFFVTRCFSACWDDRGVAVRWNTWLDSAGCVLFLMTSPFHSEEKEYVVSSFIACVGFIMLAADRVYLGQQRWCEGPNASIHIHISIFACCIFLYRGRISGCFFFLNPPSVVVVTGHTGQNTSRTEYSTCLQRI